MWLLFVIMLCITVINLLYEVRVISLVLFKKNKGWIYIGKRIYKFNALKFWKYHYYGCSWPNLDVDDARTLRCHTKLVY